MDLRYFFEISYKGTNYHGWQVQQNAISVQQVIEEKLSNLLNAKISITGSGRTDTGVHAKQQFFHVDLHDQTDCSQLKYQLNATLPRDIVVRSIRPVRPDAHARFDATVRSYDYVIILNKDPFRLNEAYIYHKSMDLDSLNAASKKFVGAQNFESFSKVKTQVNNFNCEIFAAYWQQGEDCIIFHIEANRFLRGMVRAIVGTLLMVNEGKMAIESIDEIIKKQDRSAAGRSVPPEGLYLSKISYPNHIFEI